jgi:hypothetical protein
MNDVTTYPPPTHSITTTPPPPSTAVTGAPSEVSWMVPAMLLLAVVGLSLVLRFARARKDVPR